MQVLHFGNQLWLQIADYAKSCKLWMIRIILNEVTSVEGKTKYVIVGALQILCATVECRARPALANNIGHYTKRKKREKL